MALDDLLDEHEQSERVRSWIRSNALGLLGGIVLGRRFWTLPIGRLAATSFATALFLYGFAYYGNYRYRLPYEPLMVVVAAAFVVQVWRWRSGTSPAPPE